MSRRTQRLNSLLKEVLSEVIRKNVKNPRISSLTTVTRVEITKDLTQAKVYISVLGTEEEKEATMHALKSASGYMGTVAAQQVRMRQFPTLRIQYDDSAEKLERIDTLLNKLEDEKNDDDESESL